MRRLALITGASAGIGAAFARAYAARGLDVALTARRADRLGALAEELRRDAKIETIVVPGDLASPATPAQLVAAISRPIDVLVNNAGYGLGGAFRSTTWDAQAAFLQVMAAAPAELAHRVLPGMVERGYGRIVNVASLAGLVPAAQGHTLYAAVKAFLIKFSQSLHLELIDKGVNVTALCPGFTWSEFHDVAGTRAQTNSIPKPFWQTAEEVVRLGIAANERNQPVYVPGVVNKAAAALTRLIPESVGVAMMQRGARRFRNSD